MNTNSTAYGTARPSRGRRRPFPNALWIAADTLLVLGVAGGLWLGYANRIPNVTVPEPETLAVNGYERLSEAAARMARRKEVDAAAASVYPGDTRERVFTPAEKETLVAQNAATLVALREGMALPVRAPIVRTWDQLFPELTDIRAAARLLRLEGDVHAGRGEMGQAAASYLDAMELGNDLMPDSWLIPRLVGIACEAIGRRPLVPLADTLSADEARVAATRLEEMMTARPSIAATFEQEKWGTQRVLLHQFRRERIDEFAAAASRALTTDGETEAPTTLPVRAMLLARTFPLTKAGVLKANADYMDRAIAAARQPYPKAMRPLEEPKDVVNQVLVPVFSPAVHREADARAQNALLLGKLALRAYSLERGDLPASLNGLVSAGYLKATPVDPFAPDGKATLRYQRLSATEYRLYSVGPDGKDDGGRPIENRRGPGSSQRIGTGQNSTGDFVLGANLY